MEVNVHGVVCFFERLRLKALHPDLEGTDAHKPDHFQEYIIPFSLT